MYPLSNYYNNLSFPYSIEKDSGDASEHLVSSEHLLSYVYLLKQKRFLFFY